MNAEIIQFMPRPKHDRVPTGFDTLVFRSTARPDDLVGYHADTSPREYAGASLKGIRIEDGQSGYRNSLAGA